MSHVRPLSFRMTDLHFQALDALAWLLSPRAEMLGYLKHSPTRLAAAIDLRGYRVNRSATFCAMVKVFIQAPFLDAVPWDLNRGAYGMQTTRVWSMQPDALTLERWDRMLAAVSEHVGVKVKGACLLRHMIGRSYEEAFKNVPELEGLRLHKLEHYIDARNYARHLDD